MRILSTSTSKTDGTVWASIDPNSMSAEVQKAYAKYRECQKLAREAQAAFEAAFRAEAGSEAIRFGYNFGKLSIAQGDPPKAKAQPAPKMSLADFIQGRVNGGHRV